MTKNYNEKELLHEANKQMAKVLCLLMDNEDTRITEIQVPEVDSDWGVEWAVIFVDLRIDKTYCISALIDNLEEFQSYGIELLDDDIIVLESDLQNFDEFNELVEEIGRW